MSFCFQLVEIHEPLALHKVVKNHEIEDLKDSLQRGGGVVARKTVGEFLGKRDPLPCCKGWVCELMQFFAFH